MESALPWDMLLRLTWPAAAATIAFSPLGRGVGAWFQNLGGGSEGKGHHSPDRVAVAMERIADSQETLAEAIRRMDERLIRIEERTAPAKGG